MPIGLFLPLGLVILVNEFDIKREMIASADRDLASRQVSSVLAQILVLALIVFVTYSEDLNLAATWITVALCASQSLVRGALLVWREPIAARSPKLWRWGIFSCVWAFGLIWGCFCATMLWTSGGTTWVGLFAVACLFSVAPLGINSTVSSRAAQVVYLSVLMIPYLAAVLRPGNQHGATLATVAIGLIFYCILHGQAMHGEYWGRIRANVVLAGQAENLERKRELDARQNRILEMLLSSAPLEDVVECIAETLPHQCPGTHLVILRGMEGVLECVSSRYASPALRGLLKHPVRLDQPELGGESRIRLVPVTGAGQTFGALLLELPDVPATRDQRGIIENAVRMCALAFEHHFAKDRLQFQVHHDSLTGLPNRVLYGEHLRERIAAATANNAQVCLLYIDLDGFKQVNDSLGHEVGDRFLQIVSQRLRAVLRSGDLLARIGGDEFVAVVESGIAVAEELARRMNESLKQPIVINGFQVKGAASIGLSMFPEDGREIEELQRNADYAMFRAKNEGKGRHFTFSPSSRDGESSKFGVERELRRALRDHLFILYYQPQFHPDGRLCGVEGLLRIAHPELGLMQPGQFINVAEKTGLIVPIGARVLAEACRQTKIWKAAGLNPPRVAVNVSAVQFARYDFAHSVWQVLNETGVDPGTLELELTESTIVADVDQAIRQMETIRDLGVRLSIDDFGTGYSSLNYLHRLPVHAVKIDRTFVEDLDAANSTYSLLESIVSVARKLNLEVIAEGVETAEQHRRLSELGVDSLQGYYLGRPMPAADVVRFLPAVEPAGDRLIRV